MIAWQLSNSRRELNYRRGPHLRRRIMKRPWPTNIGYKKTVVDRCWVWNDFMLTLIVLVDFMSALMVMVDSRSSDMVMVDFEFWRPRLRFRPKFASDQTFQNKIISDQTFETEIISDQTFQTEWVLIRLSRPKEFWSDHFQTMVQTQIQTIAQTLIRLWSDPISDPSSLWSDSVETISRADHSDQKHSKIAIVSPPVL